MDISDFIDFLKRKNIPHNYSAGRRNDFKYVKLEILHNSFYNESKVMTYKELRKDLLENVLFDILKDAIYGLEEELYD